MTERCTSGQCRPASKRPGVTHCLTCNLPLTMMSDEAADEVIRARIDVGLKYYGDPEALFKLAAGVRVPSLRDQGLR